MLYIDISAVGEPQSAVLATLGRYKGLRIEPIDISEAEILPAIIYRGWITQGFWPAVYYILESRLQPEVLPGGPVENAVLRTQIERLLCDHGLVKQLAHYWNRSGQFIGLNGDPPNLLDIVVASFLYTSLVDQCPWLKDIYDEVMQHVEAEAAAA